MHNVTQWVNHTIDQQLAVKGQTGFSAALSKHEHDEAIYIKLVN